MPVSRMSRPLAAEFLSEFPEINVRLHLGDRNVDLLDDHVDMAVRFGRLPDSSMVATAIGDMRAVTCANPANLERYGIPERPDDLLDCPCVTLETPLPSPGWQYVVPGSDTALEIPVVPRLTVTTTEAAAQAAIEGVGITQLLHYQVADPVVRGELQIVLEAYEPEPVPVHLIHASRGRMPLKMRRFLDFAAPRLRETLSRISEASRFR
jgi:DNA-binding transcriptional LysR family regulator